MKNIFRFSLLIIVSIVFNLTSFSCKSNNDNPVKQDEEITNQDDFSCIVGEWNFKSETEDLTFVFNDDKTGYEDINNGEGPRPFTWSTKGEDTIVIVYANETQEWELGIDCEAVQLTVWSLIYHKI